MTTASLRKKCRDRWGAQWHNVHPVIKKARLQWAKGYVDLESTVRVTEADGTSYLV